MIITKATKSRCMLFSSHRNEEQGFDFQLFKYSGRLIHRSSGSNHKDFLVQIWTGKNRYAMLWDHIAKNSLCPGGQSWNIIEKW